MLLYQCVMFNAFLASFTVASKCSTYLWRLEDVACLVLFGCQFMSCGYDFNTYYMPIGPESNSVCVDL